MCRPSDAIGVFDSGLGGISVLRQLRTRMPRERFVYFGDCANAPYGVRPRQEVAELTMRACRALLNTPVKALVVACNTATAAAIDSLRQEFPHRIIVGIEPALKLAADRHPGGTIAVMATPLTLEQPKFHHLQQHLSGACTVIDLPVAGLVELVESGRANSPQAAELLEPLLSPYRGRLDALVLGCTHYPFAAETISRILGPSTDLLDGGAGTARETFRRLEAQGLLDEEGDGSVCFRFSGSSRLPYERADSLLQADIPAHL